MKKEDFIKKLAELSESMKCIIEEAHGVKEINKLQADILTMGFSMVTATQLMIEKDSSDIPPLPPMPLAATTSVEKKEPSDAASIKYEMHLDGTFKTLKSRIVADFAEAYSERLTLITKGNQSEAARIAGLHQANYRRALQRARDARKSG